MGQLLLVDDDPDLVLAQINRVFIASQHRIDVARTGAEGIRRVAERAPDVVLLDLRLPDQSGLEVYQQIRRLDARIPVIFVTMAKAADAAIEAMKQGAYDYLFKPLDLHQLRRVVGEALEVARRMRQPAVVAETPPDPDVDGAIVGSCPAMREVYKAIGRVAAQDVPVLITGESGTGKELVARAIYQHGPRARRRSWPSTARPSRRTCWRASCSATRRGPSPGPTGAASASSSSATAAPSSSTRSATCRWPCRPRSCACSQEQAFERVGGNETIRTDVRLIAATHRDLKAWSEEGKFRPDLYYRLGVFTIHLPPLRERGDDLPLLVHHYLRRFNRELSRDVREVTPEAMERLCSYPWPGNIRELQSVLKQSLLRATGPVLVPAFLPESLGGPRTTPVATAGDEGVLRVGPFLRQRMEAGSKEIYQEAHQHLDRLLLPLVLGSTDGNKLQAARLLGITRKTLRLRLRALGLSDLMSAEEDEDDAP